MLFEHVTRDLGVHPAIIRRVVGQQTCNRCAKRKRRHKQQRIDEYCVRLAVPLIRHQWLLFIMRTFSLREVADAELSGNETGRKLTVCVTTTVLEPLTSDP